SPTYSFGKRALTYGTQAGSLCHLLCLVAQAFLPVIKIGGTGILACD
ncbi:hypothetical protein HY792_02525, partial [Candidatus Desantisbacteria bacterium]|nr:hypothetical protein [Candidatus Desantisbacteria bacterium]